MLKHKFFNHSNIYFFGLILMAVSLPLSLYFMSVSVFLLLTNWLLEGHFGEKWKILKARPGILVFSGIFLVHVLWMINSIDLAFGLHDLKTKLPILIVPLILGTSKQIDKKQLKIILSFFILSVLVGTFISMAVLFGYGAKEITDIREIALFINHVRFSVLILLAIFFLFYELIYFPNNGAIFKSIIKWVSLIWLIFFLFVLQSLTGLLMLIILALFFGLILLFKKQAVKNKYVFISLWLLAFIFLAITLLRYHSQYSYVEEIVLNNLERSTVNGNLYKHDPGNSQLENGNYVWIYLCEDELRKEWNKRSRLDYDGADLRNQELRYTIIRYLSSRGVRKDSVGFTSISLEEIEWIEKGVANYIFMNQKSMYPFFYRVLWQFDSNKRGDNPTGHSVIQRLEHYKAAINIFMKNFWFGVGTSNVKLVFDQYYEDVNSPLAPEARNRAHNQFLTFLISFGIIGFLITITTLVLPIIYEGGFKNPYFIIFITIAVLSFVAEDALETSAGSMFFAYFYPLLLFAYHDKPELNQNEGKGEHQ